MSWRRLQNASQFEIQTMKFGIKTAKGCTLKRSFQLSSSSTCQSSRRVATRWSDQAKPLNMKLRSRVEVKEVHKEGWLLRQCSNVGEHIDAYSTHSQSSQRMVMHCSCDHPDCLVPPSQTTAVATATFICLPRRFLSAFRLMMTEECRYSTFKGVAALKA